jgi:hypothetical protein
MRTTSDPRNSVRITEAGPGRRGIAVCGLALVAATLACGGSGGSSSITIQTFPGDPPYGSHPENTAVLAFQDGDGPWHELQGTNGTYSAPVTGQRYAVAAICGEIIGSGSGSASLSRVDLYYLSVSDTTHVQASGCLDTRPMVHVSAQLQGIPSGQQGEVFFGGLPATQQTDGGPFEASLVRGEPVDVLISALDASNVARKVYRGPALDGLTDQMLQYDLGVVGAPLDSQPLTVAGLDPTESVEVRSLLRTRSSQAAWFVDDRPLSTAPPDHYSTVPVAAGRQPGDLTMVSVLAVSTQASGDGRGYLRGANIVMKTPAPTTMALPAPWSIESPTLESTALRRATLTLPAVSAAQDAVDYFAQFFTPGGRDAHSWSLTIGAGWLEGQGAVTVTTPDLSGLVEGPPAIALPLDRDVGWFLSRVERNVDFGAAAADGTRVLGNQITGTIHPPAPSP